MNIWHTGAMKHLLVRRLHSSWHIAAACIGILIGVIIAGGLSNVPTASIAWLLTGSGLVLASCWYSKVGFIITAVTGGFVIGLWRGSVVSTDLVSYEPYIGTSVTIAGTVTEDIDKNKRGQVVLRLKNIELDNQKLSGSIWLTTGDDAMIRRSDKVVAVGKMNEGFGSFAASIYDADIQTIQRTKHGDIALDVRDWFANGVNRAIVEPQSSLGLGYLLGQRRGLPEDLVSALQAAGLTHIVVASGYNLTILVRLARRLFENVSKYLSFISAAGMIVSFVAITGLSPSMSRAGLVAGLSLVAWYYGRRFHPLFLLPFAMAITVLVQPSYAWGDLGWQLSFAAFAGVMVVAPLSEAYFFGDADERILRRIFIETMAATVMTLPILLVSFGQFSLVAPIANMIILPMVPLAMLLTFIAGIAGLVMPQIAWLVGLPAEVLLGYMVGAAKLTGNLPWAVQEIEIPMFVAVLAYLAIAILSVYMKRVTKYDLRSSSVVE